MLFSSLEFILVFLPLSLLVTLVARRRFGTEAALLTLLALSLVFYGWLVPAYLVLIGASILGNFLLGNAIARSRSRPLTGLGIVLNLVMLVWYKYVGLFSATFSAIAGGDFTVTGVVLPLAISFFTFQQIAYLVDCLKGKADNYSLTDYALFVTFFPQLIAGPIVHHRHLTRQFRTERFAAFRRADMASGLLLFSMGLSKKVLIADSLALIADPVFDSAAHGAAIPIAEAWLGTLAYSFQIYFDFSGYSDMALGLGLFFGILLPLNFNSPYKARSVADFWKRWHITLSQFLRDYLYVPLGGNRKGEARRYANLLVVMLLGGLWHGAGWTFMAWGGLHGLFLCVHRWWERSFGPPVQLGTFASVALTFAAASFAWIFFRATDFSAAFIVIRSLVGGAGMAQPVLAGLSPLALIALALAPLLVWGFPNAFEIYQRQASQTEPAAAPRLGPSGAFMAFQGAVSACALFILMSWGPYEFIYFQF